MQKVRVHISTAILDYISGLDYKETYLYMDQLYQVIQVCWASSNITQQANGLAILSSLCEIIDYEDINKLLTEFMPSTMQQFSQTMQAIREQNEFSYEHNVYINSIVELIAKAVKQAPQFFGQYIDEIIGNIFLVVQRSVLKDERELFEDAVEAIQTICEEYSKQVVDQFVGVRGQLMSVLR